ncbi:MAG: polysaccharide biosynthesis tyrosine autokinase [Prevotellaceae bacterium]|jgi:capsular exopolysaccharide synthesis family protein|nr:polysaccharide biosynthesis tyrosine autokinase [Prevotellaceae bacterium]
MVENRKAKSEDFQISDLWIKLVRNWYWFVLSAIVCCGLAFLYLERTPNLYVCNAAVLIKDGSRNTVNEEMAVFQDIGMFKVNTNVNNEIEAFRSPHLMQEVVQRLNLDIEYRIKNRLKTIELYTQSPIIASFPEAQSQESFSFTANLRPDSGIYLSEFMRNGEILGEQQLKAAFHDTISTPVGRVIITPSLYYTKDFNAPINIVKRHSRAVASAFISKLSVSLSERTTIIDLRLTDISIRRADDVLNTLIAVYDENRIKEKSQIAINTSNFINERLAIIEQELGGIDTDIEKYKSEHLLTDVRSAGAMFMSESSEYSSKAFELNNQLSIAKYIRDYLVDQNKAMELLPANSGLSNLNIQSQIGEYNSLLLKRENLIANSSGKNPLIMDMNNSLSALKQSIIRSVDNLIVSLNLEISGIKAQESQTVKRIASNPGQEKYLLSIERQQKIKESLYLYLLQKREENELSGAITVSNTRIINPAISNNTPVSPIFSKIILAALLIGLAIPAAIIWIRETLNTSIRGKKDLINNLTIPYLGEIPLASKRALKVDKKGLIIVQEQSRDIVSEAFRVVRTNMDFMRMRSQNLKSIMFTSFNPNSGKTFLTVNMAMSFALTGKKIMVIDLDMRKASLSEYILSPKTGISNYLSGMLTNIDAIICKAPFHANMDIIPVGVIPPNPAELLLSDNLKILLDKLKESYDYIFIDCTPVELVADTAIVGKQTDLSIFVAREGMLDRRLLPEVEGLYKSDAFNNMAVLLNCSRHAARYGYHRYGYYGYGHSGKSRRRK